MDPISVAEYRALAGTQGQWRVSILMPTHVGSSNERQDAVRLKNLLDQAARDLCENGLNPQQAEAMLAVARKLPEQAMLWHQRSQGLALYIERDGLRSFRLPVGVEERVAVSDRFVTRQLLPLLVPRFEFLLLAWGRHDARLYRGSRFELEEVSVPGLPNRLGAERQVESFDRGLQVHSVHPVGAAAKAGVFHGQGGQRDADEGRFREFVRSIQGALAPVLARSTEPLVLACVAYEAAEFRSVCPYTRIVDTIVPGDPTKLSSQDLHQKAWDVVAPQLAEEENSIVARYRQLIGTGTTSDRIDEIIPAACSGDLDSLLVEPTAEAWGRYDPVTERLEVHDTRHSFDQDLIDLAMSQTYFAKGTVRVLPAGTIPSTSGLAAVYRTGRIPHVPSPQ